MERTGKYAPAMFKDSRTADYFQEKAHIQCLLRPERAFKGYGSAGYSRTTVFYRPRMLSRMKGKWVQGGWILQAAEGLRKPPDGWTKNR